MLNITKRRERVETVSHSHDFVFEDDSSCGFSFPVDADGKMTSPHPEAQANYAACLTGAVDGQEVRDQGIVERRGYYVQYAEGECPCGRTVVLDGDTSCDCGRLYNSFGQELDPDWASDPEIRAREIWAEDDDIGHTMDLDDLDDY